MTQHLGILLSCFSGFFSLALSMDKHCKQLFNKNLSIFERYMVRCLGWSLLILGLVIAYKNWGLLAGSVILIGWLSVSGTLLAFYIPYFPWQAEHIKILRSHEKKSATMVEPLPKISNRNHTLLRGIAVILLILLPFYTITRIYFTPPHPLFSETAVRGEVGPWTFTFTETNNEEPFLLQGAPFKAYLLRFCSTCNNQIKAAYLKIRKPRSLRAAGIIFTNTSVERLVQIQIPVKAKISDQLWLTVEGKDGSVHYAPIDINISSPSLAAFLKKKI